MQFLFQDKEYNFPTSLSDITLRQRIDFNTQYGKEIFEQRAQLVDDVQNEVEAVAHHLETACKTFSFFSGIPLEDAFQIPVNQILNVYEHCLKGLLEQQEDIVLENEFVWNDEIWILGAPELNYETEINFNQFITSKQIVKAMFDLGQGQWEVLPYLCAIFLKKEDEVFDEKWMAPDNDRMEQMLDIPLDIALQVGFFLKSSMILFSQTSQYSQEEAEKDQI